MRTSSILNFALRLIKAKKGRNFLVAFSIFIGTTVLFVFLAFSAGIKEALLKPIFETADPATLIVSNDVFSLGFFDVNKGQRLDQKTVDQIKEFPETKSLGRMMALKFPSSLRVWMFGIDFETDSPIFGIDKEFLGKEAPAEWTIFERDGEEMIPIAISPRIIDAFNSSLAESIDGIPHLDANELYDRRFQINFGKSTVFQFGKEVVSKSAQIKAISARVPMIGVAVPMEVALEVAATLGKVDRENVNFSKVYLEAQTVENVASLQTKVQALGLQAKTFGEIGEEVISLILALKITLLLSSALIIFIALLSLFSLISISIIEQKKTIGILNAIGAAKSTVFWIFISQGLLIAAAGALTGLIAGFGACQLIDSFLLAKIPDISLKPVSLFIMSPAVFIGIFIAIVLAALVATFFPAQKALKITPLRAMLD